jgi:hypothetical protein
MTTKAELIAFYTEIVDDGEGEILHAEISECQRLHELYKMRLQCLTDRNPRLPLVRQGRTDLYEHYQDHFREKIRVNALAVEAAREVLEKWKGPPQRPHRVPGSSPNDNFMMDFENSLLEHHWSTQVVPCTGGLLDGLSFYFNKRHPKGRKRHEDPEWAAMVKQHVYPHHSDVDWYEYAEWVSQGGGDELLQEKDDNKWQRGQQDSERCTRNWGGLESRRSDSQCVAQASR